MSIKENKWAVKRFKISEPVLSSTKKKAKGGSNFTGSKNSEFMFKSEINSKKDGDTS